MKSVSDHLLVLLVIIVIRESVYLICNRIKVRVIHRPEIIFISISIPMNVRFEAMKSSLEIPGKESPMVHGVVVLCWLLLVRTPFKISSECCSCDELHQISVRKIPKARVRMRRRSDL